MTTMLRSIRRSLRVPSALTCAALSMAIWAGAAAHAHAQSTGPEHTGYDPTAPMGTHYHEGLTGEQALVLERNLRCTCGCGLDTHSCQFQMQCGVSPGWSQRILRELEAGRTPEEVQAGFVADYGTQVLMAPPPEGFNLVGYLLPAAMILAAGALITVVARGNMRRAGPTPIPQVSDEDAERLRAEWQKLDEAESPDW
jgi:cytochrome c-type biogenesis protein CcmH/NrfF